LCRSLLSQPQIRQLAAAAVHVLTHHPVATLTLYLLLETTHTPFIGPLSWTTWVSQYQKGKTNLDFTEARDSEWQWHQLGHMQVCTMLQADNHSVFNRPDALPATQPTASKH